MPQMKRTRAIRAGQSQLLIFTPIQSEFHPEDVHLHISALQRDTRSPKGPRKNKLSKCRVILREPRRPKIPLGVRGILRSLGLPQDDMNRLEFCNLFFREP